MFLCLNCVAFRYAKGEKNMLKKVLSIVLLIILFPILFVNGVILINSFINPDEIPDFFGWKPFIVLSGSMETQIFAGDIVVVKEENNFKIGDIIAFTTEDNIVVTHRIVDILRENGLNKYITKGDNNNTNDRGFVLTEQIEGVYKFRISGVGNVAMFMQTPIGMMSCLSIPIIILLTLQHIEAINNKKYITKNENKEKALQEEIGRLKKENEKLSKNNF